MLQLNSKKYTEILNIVFFGFCFTILFSADFTFTVMEKVIISSINDDNPAFNVDGYITLAITYACYALALWCAPFIIQNTGPKWGLVLGSTGYIIHISAFLLENLPIAYISIILGGIGGSLLWVAQGKYLVNISKTNNYPRNIGIFWILYSIALLPGNIYVATTLSGKLNIDKDTRKLILITLSAISGASIFMFLLLKNKNNVQEESKKNAFVEIWRIFKSKNLLLLFTVFTYTGFQQSFGSGIYSASIGFTKNFGSYSKQLVPIAGICYGLGEILGATSQILTTNLFKKIFSFPRSMLITFGFSLQLLAYLLLGLLIPKTAVFGDTFDLPIIFYKNWNISLSLLSGILLGYGDSILNTQIYPLIVLVEPKCNVHIIALYKFIKSVAMAVFFVISTFCNLQIQLSLASIVGIIGISTFILLDINIR